jgi:hypothetical protein
LFLIQFLLDEVDFQFDNLVFLLPQLIKNNKKISKKLMIIIFFLLLTKVLSINFSILLKLFSSTPFNPIVKKVVLVSDSYPNIERNELIN